jgi:hypothetical protein
LIDWLGCIRREVFAFGLAGRGSTLGAGSIGFVRRGLGWANKPVEPTGLASRVLTGGLGTLGPTRAGGACNLSDRRGVGLPSLNVGSGFDGAEDATVVTTAVVAETDAADEVDNDRLFCDMFDSSSRRYTLFCAMICSQQWQAS